MRPRGQAVSRHERTHHTHTKHQAPRTKRRTTNGSPASAEGSAATSTSTRPSSASRLVVLALLGGAGILIYLAACSRVARRGPPVDRLSGACWAARAPLATCRARPRGRRNCRAPVPCQQLAVERGGLDRDPDRGTCRALGLAQGAPRAAHRDRADRASRHPRRAACGRHRRGVLVVRRESRRRHRRPRLYADGRGGRSAAVQARDREPASRPVAPLPL